MRNEVPIIYWLMLTLFVGLKLTDQIDWHWLWVISPLWVYILINFVIAFIGGFIRAFKKSFRKTHRHG